MLNGQWSCSVPWAVVMRTSVDIGHVVFNGHTEFSGQWSCSMDSGRVIQCSMYSGHVVDSGQVIIAPVQWVMVM